LPPYPEALYRLGNQPPSPKCNLQAEQSLIFHDFCARQTNSEQALEHLYSTSSVTQPLSRAFSRARPSLDRRATATANLDFLGRRSNRDNAAAEAPTLVLLEQFPRIYL
jgi:hypothetical protein